MSEKPTYHAKNGAVHKSPVERKTETGTSISLGFPVCKMLDYVGDDAAETVAELMNLGEQHAEVTAELARLRERETALVAENEQLREALKPFARVSEQYPDARSDSMVQPIYTRAPPITFGDCHRARASLAKQEGSADA